MGINIKYFFLGTRKGTSDRGEYYVVTMLVEESSDNGRSFNIDCYVDVDMYVNASALTRFQEVDAIFVPRYDGKAKLISLVGL